MKFHLFIYPHVAFAASETRIGENLIIIVSADVQEIAVCGHFLVHKFRRFTDVEFVIVARECVPIETHNSISYVPFIRLACELVNEGVVFCFYNGFWASNIHILVCEEAVVIF